MEASIVKALLDKGTYEEFRPFIKDDMFAKGRRSPYFKMVEQIDSYFKKYEDNLSVEELYQVHSQKLAGVDEKTREKLKGQYQDVQESVVDGGVKALFDVFRIKDLQFKVEECLENGDYEKAQKALDTIKEIESGEEHVDENIYMDLDLTALTIGDDENGLQWFLPKLHDLCGNMTSGTSTLVLARSNAGKTSFIIPQVKKALENDKKVLHICLSEDGREELAIRYAMGMFTCTQEKVLSNVQGATEALKDAAAGKLRIINTGRMSAKAIEDELDAMKAEGFEPDLVVYDQYQKMFVKTNSSASGSEVRTEVSQRIKDIANKYDHHALCATQADAQSGWVVTEMNVDQSKTGVVGEFKTIIGIGKQEDDRPKFFIDKQGNECQGLYRNINVAKNKGKLGSFPAYLMAEICKWEEE